MAQIKSPLNDKDLVTLTKLIQSCLETAQYCQHCADCNLDVDPEKQKNGEQMEIAKRIKAKFFPNSK